jgi:hypothetical protein
MSYVVTLAIDEHHRLFKLRKHFSFPSLLFTLLNPEVIQISRCSSAGKLVHSMERFNMNIVSILNICFVLLYICFNMEVPIHLDHCNS